MMHATKRTRSERTPSRSSPSTTGFLCITAALWPSILDGLWIAELCELERVDRTARALVQAYMRGAGGQRTLRERLVPAPLMGTWLDMQGWPTSYQVEPLGRLDKRMLRSAETRWRDTRSIAIVTARGHQTNQERVTWECRVDLTQCTWRQLAQQLSNARWDVLPGNVRLCGQRITKDDEDQLVARHPKWTSNAEIVDMVLLDRSRLPWTDTIDVTYHPILHAPVHTATLSISHGEHVAFGTLRNLIAFEFDMEPGAMKAQHGGEVFWNDTMASVVRRLGTRYCVASAWQIHRWSLTPTRQCAVCARTVKT